MESQQYILWSVFGVLVIGLLFLDLCVFHKRAHIVRLKEALLFSCVWIAIALIFNIFVYYELGHEKALEFLTGYLIEKSLSVDNLFVFVAIFAYFGIASIYHHRILFWGIVGAIVMRAIFIASGIALINKFHWIIYVFGAFLVITGIKMLFFKEREIHPDRNFFVRALKKFVPIQTKYDGGSFLIRQNGKIFATPLLVVIIVVETTDVMFAVDSIPAIFAVTNDPFIVYTSNIFAILGLRSLYFLLADIMGRFAYLKIGLSFVLAFVGVKMLMVDFYKIPITIALGVVAAILGSSIVISLVRKPTNSPTLPITKGR